ncbi:MAG: site-specific integrase, partial [Desulfobacterales bacterium]|nr:site-specific integrase [Desulfobacterales bacterium]
MRSRERRQRQVRWKTMKRHSITLEELIRHYEVLNRSEGKSPATVHYYNEKLNAFIRFLEAQGIDPRLTNVGIADVRAFIRYLQEKPRWDRHAKNATETAGLSPATVHGHVRALRAFYAWLHREGYTKTHLLADLRPPKVPRKLVTILTPEEIRRTLDC